MNKILTISFVILLGCFFILIPTTVQARLPIINFEKSSFLQTSCVNRITKEEMEILLKGANSMVLKRLADEPELKKQQIENLRELLAIACQAIKGGFADDYNVREELKNIEIELTAINYDREKNKDKSSMPPFSFITANQIKEFYVNKGSLSEFETYFKVKVQLARENGQMDKEPTKDDVEQAKNYFAKTRIYYREVQGKSNELPKEFWSKLDISVKLQKAQLLSRLYTRKVLDGKTKVTDDEVKLYIKEHPELTKARKAKAYEILLRAKSGEDFAKLATEFSEDSGSKDNGGLYEGIKRGDVMSEIETAALSLKPGQIYANLIETPFGYHIIKLERKGIGTYDFRQILILTNIEDPNKMLAPMPVSGFVRNKLEKEKEKQVKDEILTNNPVEVAEDFEIPRVSDEQLQQAMQQQMQVAPQQTKTDNQTLPTNIKNYLNRYYRGWKLVSTADGCSAEYQQAIVTGDFDGDRKTDYAIKILKGNKGYILAFLERRNSYETHVLHNMSASELKNTALGIFRKGEKWTTGDIEDENPSFIRLKNDALFDGPCASDAGGIHVYQNRRFVAM